MSTSLAWQIPYEHLAEFTYLFRILKFKFRTTKSVYNYFKWYYSIQNGFEKNLQFSEEEYDETMKWLKDVTNDQSIALSIDVFSVAYLYSITRLYKYATQRTHFMCSDSLIEEYLKCHPTERYVSESS